MIGGMAAGMSTTNAAREVNPNMEITVVERSGSISYGLCNVPYFISDDIRQIKSLVALTPNVVSKERGIKVLTNHESLEINPKERKVFARNLHSGKKLEIPYDRLVIATGALPIRLLVPGCDLRNIFTVRTLSDAMEIKKCINDWTGFNTSIRILGPCVGHLRAQKQAMKAIIVGGGYTGIMMCEPLRNMGLEVTVLEKTERILGTADVEITQILEKELENKGVKLIKGVSVERFVGHEGSVTEVVTNKGRFDTNLVLIAVGTRPKVELAKRAGINVGVNGAIKVDKYMRTNISGVYAAGDCVEILHFITKKNACNCLGIGANRQGKIAGENAAGMRNEFKGFVNTTMVDVFGLKVARTGLSAIDAESNGYDYFVSATIGKSICRAYPDGKPITMSCTVDKTNGRLLGAGIVGQGGVKQRIDTLATCIYAKMTIKDVNNLELVCMQPFAEGPDPILVAADEALRKWRH